MRFILIAALLVTTCTNTSSEAGHYNLGEFYIDGPNAIETGVRSIAATNSGEFPHTIIVTDDNDRVIAGTELIQPGDIAHLVVDLAEGTYRITCRIVAEKDDGRLVDHYEAGMGLTLRVTA